MKPLTSLGAWREAFELAVHVFRLTRDDRVGGLASRARRSVLRVPVLIARAAACPAAQEGRPHLDAALRVLDELEEQVRAVVGPLHTEPREVRHIAHRLAAARREIQRLRAQPTARGPDPGLVPGDRAVARNSLPDGRVPRRDA